MRFYLFITAMVMAFATWGFGADANSAGEPNTQTEAAWPRLKTVEGYNVSVYQPQIESWENNAIKARAAIVAKAQGSDKPIYGAIFFDGKTDINKEERKVNLTELKIEKVVCPTAPQKQDELKAKLSKLVPETLSTSLDHLEVSLAMSKARQNVKEAPIKNPVPQIFYSTEPGLLVLVDGEPVMKDYGAGIKKIMNTEPLIMFNQATNAYYMRIAFKWVEASDLGGPWKLTKKVPDEIAASLEKAIDANQTDLIKSPGEAIEAELAKGIAPAIFVSTKPAELIVTYGEPNMQLIPDTNVMWVTNTISDLLVDGTTKQFYFLTSGRWFKSAALNGPWSFVAAKDVPADFKKIPADHPRGAVLASIPGTPQANESLIANAIPQTATIKKSEAKFKPTFDGEPQFVPIEGTNLKYAKNSPVPIIFVPGNTYYAVSDGVWFKAKELSDEWVVADSVPAEIYSIPPSSPVYNATYVQAYGSTDDEAYFGYTPGYYGTVAYDDTVVYGTGYYYEPWVGSMWYGAPITYGDGVAFGYSPRFGWTFGYDTTRPLASPWWGPMAWGWNGNSVSRYNWNGYGDWGGAANANVYRRWGDTAYRGGGATWQNPWTGREGAARSGAVYNPATGSFAAGEKGVVYNPKTGNYAAGARGMAYNGRTGGVSTGARGTSGNVYYGGVMTGTQDRFASQGSDLYADRQGQVYRNQGQGQWQRYGQDGWSGAGVNNDLNRENNVRDSDFARQRQSMGAGTGRVGGYRGYGGGMRGGGRR